MPEGVDDFVRGKRLVGQREEQTLVEKCQDFSEQPAGQLRTLRHQLIRIDAEITDVVAEWAQTNAGVLVEIALAEFEEAAKGLQNAEVAVNRLPGERIQDNIDSLATGDSEDLIGELKVA